MTDKLKTKKGGDCHLCTQVVLVGKYKLYSLYFDTVDSKLCKPMYKLNYNSCWGITSLLLLCDSAE